MKNKIFIIAFLLLIILFTVIFCGNSYAASRDISADTNKANLTVTGVEAGVKISEYKLISVNYDYEKNQPVDPEYTWDANVASWLNTKYPSYTNPENFKKAVDENSIDARTFYDELTKAIKNGSINLNPAYTETLGGNNVYPIKEENLTGSKVFENLSMGTYLTVIENGYMVYMPSVVNLAPEFNETTNKWILNDANVTVKSSNLGITKTIAGDTKNKDTASLNSTINYIIKTDVPTYLQNSVSKTYKISDNLDSTLTLSKESIKITGISANSGVLTANNEYTISFDDTNNSFEINFNYDKIKQYNQIKVEYSAKLNKTAIVGNTGNNNDAKLTYSNNPYVASSTQVQETNTTIFTYQIDINKKDKSSNENLEGAVFSITDAQNNKLYFVEDSVNKGVYYLSESNVSGATTSVATNSSGKISLIGLNVGEYTLKEEKAPNGYIKSNSESQITLVDSDLDGNLDSLNSGIYELTVKNSKNFLIPTTGGSGIVIFIIAGIILIAFGLIILFKGLKNNKN